MSRPKIDGLALVAFLFVLFILHNLFEDWRDLAPAAAMSNPDQAAVVSQARKSLNGAAGQPKVAEIPVVLPAGDRLQLDQDALQMPYADYAVTQGLHGYEYGHTAIDITAGKGAQIHSPINGLVTANFTDPAGGTILVIENERWIVILVHGIFSIPAGEFVRLGQVVGLESNQGDTVDMEGRSCRGRDCGYHTHINVLDKRTGQNVDLLALFPVVD